MNRIKVKRRCITLAVVLPIIILTQVMRPDRVEEIGEPPVRPAKVMTIEKEELSFERVFSGRTKAAKSIDLTFEVPGRLMEFPVRESQELKKGDLIARIEPADYQSRLNAAKAQFDKAEIDLKRAETLFKKKVIPEAQLEVSRVNYDVAKANYDTSKKAYDNTFIYAPYDGTVSRKYAENYQQVAPNMPIVNFQSLKMVDINIDVPEKLLSYAPEKYKAEFKAQFSSDKNTFYPLEIKEFSTIPDPQTKTFPATLTMERPEGFFVFSGMSVTVFLKARNIEIDGSSTRFFVPSSAVSYDINTKKSRIWKVSKDLTVYPQPVVTGQISGDRIEISSGLNEGDIIVVAGTRRLTDGQKIRFYNGEQQ